FSSSFSCSGFGSLGPMASGSALITMQTGPCAMTLQGGAAFFGRASSNSFARMAIDALNNVYVESTGHDAYGFAAGGRLHWTWTSAEYLVAGPLLTSKNELIVVTADSSQGWDHATHLNFVVLDAATGHQTASYLLNAHLSSAGFSVLLTA